MYVVTIGSLLNISHCPVYFNSLCLLYISGSKSLVVTVDRTVIGIVFGAKNFSTVNARRELNQ